MAIIEEWVKQADLDNWKGWTSALLIEDQPSLGVDRNREIEALMGWLHARVWPRRYPELEAAFKNFLRILQDLYSTFHEHARNENGKLRTKTFHCREEDIFELYDDDELANQLYRKYYFHVKLVQDLTLELTRAANYICDKVRQYIDPLFRIREGVLLTMSGPYMRDFCWHEHRPEYREEERTLSPYPGLNEFKRIRINRDCYFGQGIDADDSEAGVDGNDNE